MLFESIPPIVLAAVISSIVSGFILTFNNYWMNSSNNKFQLKREKEQRTWQEKSEQQKWYREKTYDSYKTLIQILTKIIQAEFEIENGNKLPEINWKDKALNLNNIYSEFNCEFTIIIVGHPDKDSKEFQIKVTEISGYALEGKALLARTMITKMMENDSRIKEVNNNT